MTDAIDDLTVKTAKTEIDAKIKKWNELSPETKLQYIEMMDFDTKKISQNRPSATLSENIVKLNIGGTLFQTSRTTLTNFEGMFKTMLETDEPITKDDAGCIFIDRDPQHFRLILNYMRAKTVKLPDSEKELDEIQEEAQYYKLHILWCMCRAKVYGISLNKLPLDENLQFLTTNEQLLQVISNPKKPILIIYYHIGSQGQTILPHGFYTNYLESYKLLPFKVFFKSYTARDCPISAKDSYWAWSLHYQTYYSYGSAIGERENWFALLKKDADKFLTNSCSDY